MTQALESLLDEGTYLTDFNEIAKYSIDIVGDFESTPLGVMRPRTTEEVSKIMTWCHANKIPVIPQGGNTGLCGGCIPKDIEGAVILSTDRMNQVRDLDVMGNTLTVEAGCVLADVQKLALDNNRFSQSPMAVRAQPKLVATYRPIQAGIMCLNMVPHGLKFWVLK